MARIETSRRWKSFPALWLALGLAVLAGLWLRERAVTGASGAGGDQVVRVVFIPADGGTASGTLADFRPLFAALTESTGMRFDLNVTQSYSAAVEALCNGSADVAFVGPGTYLQAHRRQCADLLATGIRKGRAQYYSGIFVRKDAPYRTLADLRGSRMAFGDINSTSSFVMPVAMLLEAGVDPSRDLAAVRLTGSHSNSLAALVGGQVDAAALSFDSFDRALQAGLPGIEGVRVLARSQAMPYPPFVASKKLDATRRDRLRKGFSELERRVRRVPGYAGQQLDSYSAAVDQRAFDDLSGKVAPVTRERVVQILRRAGR